MNCSTNPTRERGSNSTVALVADSQRCKSLASASGLYFCHNEVVTSCSGIESAAAKEPTATQRMLFLGMSDEG